MVMGLTIMTEWIRIALGIPSGLNGSLCSDGVNAKVDICLKENENLKILGQSPETSMIDRKIQRRVVSN